MKIKYIPYEDNLPIINKIVIGESILEKNDITFISKNMYKKMGYDVDKMVADGRLTLDLFPRKGKNTHGFCFGVEAGKDSRILAKLISDSLML